jgi:hypothetical protein
MITVFSTQQALRSPRTELYGGELVCPHESMVVSLGVDTFALTARRAYGVARRTK